jgi:hypothetical protein
LRLEDIGEALPPCQIREVRNLGSCTPDHRRRVNRGTARGSLSNRDTRDSKRHGLSRYQAKVPGICRQEAQLWKTETAPCKGATLPYGLKHASTCGPCDVGGATARNLQGRYHGRYISRGSQQGGLEFARAQHLPLPGRIEIGDALVKKCREVAQAVPEAKESRQWQ